MGEAASDRHTVLIHFQCATVADGDCFVGTLPWKSGRPWGWSLAGGKVPGEIE